MENFPTYSSVSMRWRSQTAATVRRGCPWRDRKYRDAKESSCWSEDLSEEVLKKKQPRFGNESDQNKSFEACSSAGCSSVAVEDRFNEPKLSPTTGRRIIPGENAPLRVTLRATHIGSVSPIAFHCKSFLYTLHAARWLSFVWTNQRTEAVLTFGRTKNKRFFDDFKSATGCRYGCRKFSRCKSLVGASFCVCVRMINRCRG